jgi:hypothetical protein
MGIWLLHIAAGASNDRASPPMQAAGAGEEGVFPAVPAGLDFSKPFPALKCRAIFDCSDGTEHLLKN